MPALITPPTWMIADAAGDTATRLLMRRLSNGGQWDGCEALNLYRVPRPLPEQLVLDNADRILRDSHATDISACRLDVEPHGGFSVIATRASGTLRTGKRLVHSHFTNYVVTTAADSALIEQAILISDDMRPALDSEAVELTENLHHALRASLNVPRPVAANEGT